MLEFDHLLAIVRTLRGENGCPWDQAQTSLTMRPYLLEETYEVLDALDRGDSALLQKELGDLVFVATLIARIAEDEQKFTMASVLASVNEKMIRRHPHVFGGDEPAAGSGTPERWEARKAQESTNDRSVLDGVPEALPALLRAHRVTEKASRVGFDWPNGHAVRTKLDEELRELDDALRDGEPEAVAEEFGDVLFTLVNLGRFLPATAEDALRQATTKFEKRFRAVEDRLREQGLSVHDVHVDTLEALWNEVKRVPHG